MEEGTLGKADTELLCVGIAISSAFNFHEQVSYTKKNRVNHPASPLLVLRAISAETICFQPNELIVKAEKLLHYEITQ